MADTKVSALTENTATLGGDLLYQVDDPSGTPASKKMIAGNLNVAAVSPVQGGLRNGYISRTVSSNNLTVAVKTLAGGDPSATDPVYVRIGNTVRTITSALSVTKNAGTNWFAAGSSEMATHETDYFVYMGYNATDGTVIGFARFPNAITYGDFSATSTNEKYCAISTITNATATDEYEVIGRANATLSAGAGYTWSVPATSVVISRPVYESRPLTWTPTQTGFSADPASGLYYYSFDEDHIIMKIRQPNTGTSNATGFTLTAPFNAKTLTNGLWSGVGIGTDNNAVFVPLNGYITTGAATITLLKSGSATGFTGSSNKSANQITIIYEY